MSDTMFKIRQIISLVVFIGALSLMGMITERPIMIAAYGAVFIAVTVLMYFIINRRQRHFEITQTDSTLLYRIFGIALGVCALGLPLLIVFRSSVIKLPAELSAGTAAGIVGGVTVAFIALMVLAVHLINTKGKELVMRSIGFILIIIASAIPGLLMSKVDRTTSGIGSVYYVAMAVLILAYNSYSMLFMRRD